MQKDTPVEAAAQSMPTGINRANADAMHAAICDAVSAGVTFVVAAGNDSADAATSTPAAYDEVITVSALAHFNGLPGGGAASTCRSDVDDTFADFSNYGSDVDIIAPGVCIESTWKGGGYNTISGTSMATPHVTGAAALDKSTHPSTTPAQVKAALQNSGSLDWNNADDHDSTKEPCSTRARSDARLPGPSRPSPPEGRGAPSAGVRRSPSCSCRGGISTAPPDPGRIALRAQGAGPSIESTDPGGGA